LAGIAFRSHFNHGFHLNTYGMDLPYFHNIYICNWTHFLYLQHSYFIHRYIDAYIYNKIITMVYGEFENLRLDGEFEKHFPRPQSLMFPPRYLCSHVYLYLICIGVNIKGKRIAAVCSEHVPGIISQAKKS
jgi:hypothetical protein